MTAPYLLTVDLGTSGPKAAVVGIDGLVVGAGQAKVTTLFPVQGAAEQDPAEIWAATLDVCRAALAESRSVAGVEPAEVVAVIISSQYSSVVPVDSDGNHLANMVIWMDQRGSPKRIKHRARLPESTRLTGGHGALVADPRAGSDRRWHRAHSHALDQVLPTRRVRAHGDAARTDGLSGDAVQWAGGSQPMHGVHVAHDRQPHARGDGVPPAARRAVPDRSRQTP